MSSRSGDRAGQRSGDRVIARDPTPARATAARSGDPGDREIGAHLQQCRSTEVSITRSPDHPITRSADTPAFAEVSFWSEQAPATVPVPHEVGYSRFKLSGTIFLRSLRKMCGVLLAVLREIFDENAYERFLQRTHCTRSVASYSSFVRERDAGMAQRPRCC
jgi:hypothetical protein